MDQTVIAVYACVLLFPFAASDVPQVATGSNQRRKEKGRTWMKTKLQVNTNLI